MNPDDLNDFLSIQGNNVSGLSSFFDSGSTDTGSGPVTSAASGPGIGQSISDIFSSLGGGIGNLLGGILSPATSEINFLTVALLVAIVVIVLIVALNAGEIGKFLKINAIF